MNPELLQLMGAEGRRESLQILSQGKTEQKFKQKLYILLS